MEPTAATSTNTSASPQRTWQHATVSRADRWERQALWGATVWFTGLSGAGKSTIADAVAEQLHRAGIAHAVLDGDTLRHGLNADLSFTAADRSENVRRIGEVARLLADAGIVALVPVISPYSADRDRVRAMHENDAIVFLEVFVDTPLAVCEQRDVKGLYARVRAGELTGFTGIDAPYEAPALPDVRLAPEMGDPSTLAASVVAELQARRANRAE